MRDVPAACMMSVITLDRRMILDLLHVVVHLSCGLVLSLFICAVFSISNLCKESSEETHHDGFIWSCVLEVEFGSG